MSPIANATLMPSSGYDTPTFSWTSVPGAANYYLYVADNLTPLKPLISQAGVSGLTFTPGPSQALTPGHSYTWYIGAESTNGAAIAWSGPQGFSLALLPFPPAQMSPIDNITLMPSSGFDTPTFSWGSVTGAAHYYLYVADNLTPLQPSIVNSSVSGLTFTPSASQALTPGHSYTWYIGAESTNGAAIAWSGPQGFSLAPLPTPPMQTDLNNITIHVSTGYDTPTFSWSNVSGAASYDLFVTDNLSPHVAVIGNPASGLSVSGVTYVASAGLTPGHSFTWYIGAESANGVAFDWSGPQGFSLDPLTPPPMQMSPSDNAALTASSGYDTPTFSWTSVTGAARYYLYVADNLTPLQPSIVNSSVSGLTFTPGPSQALTPGHSYTWYIGAESTNGAAVAWSGPQGFSLDPLTPPPMQMSPIDNITLGPSSGYDTPTFSWSSVTGAARYYLYVADNLTPLQPSIVNSSVNGLTFTPGPSQALTPGHSYTWYIGAESTNGDAVAWSGPQGFTLAPLTTPPMQMSPIDNITLGPSTGYDTPTFSWSSVSGAASYDLFVTDNLSPHVAVIGNPASGLSVNGVTYVASGGLTPGHSYTWYIGAETANAAAVAWSGSAGFSLAPLTTPPTQVSPIDNVTLAASSGYDTPTFSWTSVTGAASYDLTVRDAGTGQAAFNISNFSGTSYSGATLTPGHSYTWTIGAASTNSAAAIFSNSARFTLAALAAPTPIGPSGTIAVSIGYDSPTFSWSSVTGAASYDLSVFDSTTDQAVIDNADVYGTSYSGATLTPGHSYTWTIGATSTNGTATTFSSATGFSLAALAAPTVAGPIGTIPVSTGYDTPTFSWSSVTDAASYNLSVQDATTSQAIVNNPDFNGTSYIPSTPLTPGHSYTWSIGAVSMNGAAIFTSSQSFTLAALAAPTVAGPIGTIPVSTGYDTPTFSWSSVTDAASYNLSVQDATTSQAIVNNPDFNGTSYIPSTPLTPGHSYTWSIGAVSMNGAATFISSQSFMLAALAAPTPAGPVGTIAVSTGFDTPTFSWSSVTDAASYDLKVFDSTANQAVINTPGITGTSYSGTTLTPGHSYTWSIGATSINGAAATFSSSQSFALAALAAPTLTGPSGTIPANSGYDVPTFSWNSITAAAHYSVSVQDNTAGQAVVNNPNVSATSYTPSTPLTPGHSYTWTIGAVSTNGAATFTSSQSFMLAALAAPTPAGPSDNVTIAAVTGYDTPTFSWSSVQGAAHYYLKVLDAATSQAVVNNASINGTSFTGVALTPGHSYTWTIGATSTNGAATTVSGSTGFTLAALAAPSPLGASGTIPISPGYDTPTFSWGRVVGANHYYLSVMDSTTGQAVVDDPSISGTSYPLSTPLPHGDSYTWHVGAASTNDTVTFSGTVSFTFASTSPSGAPTPISPSDNVTIAVATGYDTPTFSWSSVQGADHYSLSVMDATTDQAVVSNPSISGTSYTSSTALTPGHSFTWTIAAVSSNGAVVDSSASTGFALAALAAPTPVGPSGTIAASNGYDTPTFSWSSVTGAAHYDLTVMDATTGQARQHPQREHHVVCARACAGADAGPRLHLVHRRGKHQWHRR